MRIAIALQNRSWQFGRASPSFRRTQRRSPVKNTKRNAGKNENQSVKQLRASALRALSEAKLKAVRGGTDTGPQPPSSDPIC